MKFYGYRLGSISFFLLLFLTILNPTAIAQRNNEIDLSRLVHIGMEQGLSSNKINCVFQDKEGFIWFGTDYGLNRYDGYNFKIFTSIEEDISSLTDNDIKCVTQDAVGDIWIGTARGLNVMNYKTKKITRFVSKVQSDSIWKYSINITALAADEKSVWIGTSQRGLIQYNIFDRQLRQYVKVMNDPDSLVNNSVINNLIVENNGNILAGLSRDSHTAGLLELNMKTRLLGRIHLERKLLVQRSNYIKNSSNDAIETIYKDSYGNIYIGTFAGGTFNTKTCDTCKTSYQIDDYEGKSFFRSVTGTTFKEIKPGNKNSHSYGLINRTSFVEYKPGKLFFFNRKTCGIFDLQNFDPQLLNVQSVRYPKGIEIEKVFKDRSGLLWFITSGGIEKLEPLPFQYEDFSLKSINPNSIVEDKEGMIWIGTNHNSLISFDIQKNKSTVYEMSNNENSEFNASLSPTTGIIYGINGFDPYEFNKSSGAFKRLAALDKLLSPQNKNFEWNNLYCTSDGSLWIRVKQKGIGKLNAQTGEINYIVPNDTISGEQSSNDDPYFDDGKEYFYYGSPHQIIQVNYRIRSYKVFNIQDAGLVNPNNTITSITKDDAENLWLGTRYQGLLAFNIQSHKTYNLLVRDGLPTNKTSRILFVDGAIWVIHQNGIYKLIPPKNFNDKTQKLIIKTYGVKDGLPNIDFTTKAMIKCRDSKILFAADNTFISFYPDSIQSNKYVPPVTITILQVNNTTIEAGDSANILLHDIGSTDTIHLNHFQNSLSLEFAALNFIKPEANEYAYRMDGIDSSWIYCGKRRFVTYSNLSPGEYTFHVKGSNNDGVWNEVGVKLTIIIYPPWWKTWLAYLIYLTVFVTAILGSIRIRTSSLLKQKKRLEKKIDERTNELQLTQTKLLQKERAELSQQISVTEMKALRSQMNPHFIFNALQSIQNFLFVNKPDEANIYLLKFSKLMRLVLENSQHQEIPLKEDLKALELYMQLESIRLPYPFTFQVHIDKTVDVEEITIPPLILQPFVENAIWHGLQYKPEPGHIDIYISRKNDALFATVEDNGIGRDATKKAEQHMLIKKESLGMKLTEDRLKILNELKNIKAQFKITDLYTKANQPAGTKVELFLPLTG